MQELLRDPEVVAEAPATLPRRHGETSREDGSSPLSVRTCALG